MRQMTAHAGSRIDSTITAAIVEAASVQDTIEFEFNGVTVHVTSDSDAALIQRDWERGMLRPSGTFIVDPYPSTQLSAEQRAEDARLTAEREERARVAHEEYQKQEAAKKAVLQGALSTAQPLALKDEAAWQAYVDANIDDGYGAACVRYAENWARLMQERMSHAQNTSSADWIAVNADECSHVADDEGITGFMYGAAVSMLSQCWTYGEELRQWHNLKTQLGHEGENANESGGVLNPALLSIG